MTPHSTTPRAVIVIVALSITLEGSLYSAITPLLPFLTREFTLSDTAAGLLVSAYSAGMVTGALACVPVLAQVNARNAASGGLCALAATTALFAAAHVSPVLICARLGQGLSAGFIWTACVFWLLRTSLPAHRGAALGKALSYSVVGTVAGPLIGTLGVRWGAELVYTVVAVGCLVLALSMILMPQPAKGSTATASAVALDVRARSFAYVGVWIVGLAGVVGGLMNLAGPLVLTRLGASDFFVGMVFLAAASATILIGGPTGSLADRHGAAVPLVTGLLIVSGMVALVGTAMTVHLNAAVIIALSAGIIICYVPGGSVLTRAGEAAGWSLQFATALAAVVWGIGETVGAITAGYGMETIGAQWTSITTSALVLVTLAGAVAIAKGDPDPYGYRKNLR